MVDIDTFTDDELRTKLVEYGFPVMPITGTTRVIMAKKLKLLMEGKGKSTSDRRSLGKFSSDEESDADAKATKKEKNRRVTMAVPPMQTTQPKPVPKHRVTVEDKPEMEPPAVAPLQKEKRKSSARSAKIIVQVKESPDTNSDSEPEIVAEYKKQYEIEVPLKKPQPTSTMKTKEDSPAPFKPSESLTSRKATSTSTASSLYTSYGKSAHDVSEELAKIRSRLSMNSRTDYMVQTALNSPSNMDADDEPPRFLSNFTRRLSASRNGASVDYDDNPSSALYSRSDYALKPFPREYSKSAYAVSSTESGKETDKSSNISVILIAVVALFFVVLAALYYGMHSGNNVGAIVGKSSKYEPQDTL